MRQRLAFGTGLLATAVIVVILVGLMKLPCVSAQSATSDWEKTAGGKMSFAVASVKENTSSPGNDIHSNVNLSYQPAFTPTGGLFSATNYPLLLYMNFAYRLAPRDSADVARQLPEWAVVTKRYDIEARASGNPTKDQMRLMMQALLADRFKLAVHVETKDGPVFAVRLVNPRKTGPQLLPHSDDPPCADSMSPTPLLTSGGLRMRCWGMTILGTPNNHPQMAARNVTIQQIADALSRSFDRPLVDETGLSGTFDFMLNFPGPDAFALPGRVASPDTTGIIENMKDQLGLKLEPRTAPIRRLVVDHIEQPTPN